MGHEDRVAYSGQSVVSMAMVVVGFVALFNDLGTSAAVIQRREVPDRFLSSIFWVNVAFGLLAAVAVFILSPLAAGFYGELRVTPLLRLLSVTFLISGLGVLQKALLERDLAFRKLARVLYGRRRTSQWSKAPFSRGSGWSNRGSVVRRSSSKG